MKNHHELPIRVLGFILHCVVGFSFGVPFSILDMWKNHISSLSKQNSGTIQKDF